jgi:hypothetical protein
MKHFIRAVVVVAAALVVMNASAQVYVPGGAPLCFPQTYMTPTGPVTVVICQ